jgi:hypothetical protein
MWTHCDRRNRNLGFNLNERDYERGTPGYCTSGMPASCRMRRLRKMSVRIVTHTFEVIQ